MGKFQVWWVYQRAKYTQEKADLGKLSTSLGGWLEFLQIILAFGDVIEIVIYLVPPENGDSPFLGRAK